MKKAKSLFGVLFTVLVLVCVCCAFVACKDDPAPPVVEEPTDIEYTVTFDANGGSGTTAKTVKSGELLPAPTGITKSGYTLEGWYSDKEAKGKKWDFAADTVVSTMTLYANWKGNSYTVTLNADGGVFAGGTKTTLEVTKGESYTISAKPTRTGYIFGGWSSSDGRTVYTDDKGASKTVCDFSENKTFLAIWIGESATVAITRNLAGADFTVTLTRGTQEIAVGDVKIGDQITFTAGKSDYFEKWIFPDKTVTEWQDGAKSKTTYTIASKTVEIQAVWRTYKLDVVIDDGKGTASLKNNGSDDILAKINEKYEEQLDELVVAAIKETFRAVYLVTDIKALLKDDITKEEILDQLAEEIVSDEAEARLTNKLIELLIENNYGTLDLLSSEEAEQYGKEICIALIESNEFSFNGTTGDFDAYFDYIWEKQLAQLKPEGEYTAKTNTETEADYIARIKAKFIDDTANAYTPENCDLLKEYVTALALEDAAINYLWSIMKSEAPETTLASAMTEWNARNTDNDESFVREMLMNTGKTAEEVYAAYYEANKGKQAFKDKLTAEKTAKADELAAAAEAEYDAWLDDQRSAYREAVFADCLVTDYISGITQLTDGDLLWEFAKAKADAENEGEGDADVNEYFVENKNTDTFLAALKADAELWNAVGNAALEVLLLTEYKEKLALSEDVTALKVGLVTALKGVVSTEWKDTLAAKSEEAYGKLSAEDKTARKNNILNLDGKAESRYESLSTEEYNALKNRVDTNYDTLVEKDYADLGDELNARKETTKAGIGADVKASLLSEVKKEFLDKLAPNGTTYELTVTPKDAAYIVEGVYYVVGSEETALTEADGKYSFTVPHSLESVMGQDIKILVKWNEPKVVLKEVVNAFGEDENTDCVDVSFFAKKDGAWSAAVATNDGYFSVGTEYAIAVAPKVGYSVPGIRLKEGTADKSASKPDGIEDISNAKWIVGTVEEETVVYEAVVTPYCIEIELVCDNGNADDGDVYGTMTLGTSDPAASVNGKKIVRFVGASGTELDFSYEPADGYELVALKDNGGNTVDADSLAIDTSATKYTLHCKAIAYNVTYSCEYGEALNNTTVSDVIYNKSYNFPVATITGGGATFECWVAADGTVLTDRAGRLLAPWSALNDATISPRYTFHTYQLAVSVSNATVIIDDIVTDSRIERSPAYKSDVTLRIIPKDGYELGTLSKSGIGAVTENTKNGVTTYSFVMPNNAVSVSMTAVAKTKEITVSGNPLTIIYNTAISVDNVPSIDGFTFNGWFDAEGELVIGTDGAQKKEWTDEEWSYWDSLVLTESWTQNYFTVNMNAISNGRIITSLSSDKDAYTARRTTFAYGETVYLIPVPNEGYELNQSAKLRANNTDVSATKSFAMGRNNAYVYVTDLFVAKECAVTLVLEGGSGETSDSVYYGTEAKNETGWVKTFAIPTKEGYTFDGWYTAQVEGTKVSDGEGHLIVVWNDDVCPDPTVATSLYARWTKKTYTITFEKNIDEAGTVPGNISEAEYDTPIGSSITVNTNEGYTFIGWYKITKTEAGEETKEAATPEEIANWTVLGDATLRAMWARHSVTVKRTYANAAGTRTYESSVPTEKEYVDAVGKVSYEDNDNADVLYITKGTLVNLTAVTTTNYTFLGWFTAEGAPVSNDKYNDGAENYSFYLNDEVLGIDGLFNEDKTVKDYDAVVVAKWKACELTIERQVNGTPIVLPSIDENSTDEEIENYNRIKENFDNTSVKIAGADFENGPLTAGSEVSLTAEAAVADYTFDGWYADGTWLSSDESYVYEMPDENTELTANWIRPEVTVLKKVHVGNQTKDTDACGINLVSSTAPTGTDTAPFYVKKDTGYTLTAVTYAGYVFEGWYSDQQILIDTAVSIGRQMTDNITFIAVWRPISYTVSLDANDLSDSPVVTCEDKATMGEALSLPTVARAGGYYFEGWYTESGRRMTDIDGKLLVGWDIAANTTLYAHWNTDCLVLSDIVYFGEYPQTLVTDAATVARLSGSTPIDGVYYDGANKYAKLTAKSNGTAASGAKLVEGNDYFFKYEKIKWYRFIDENGECKLVSALILNATSYWNGEAYAYATVQDVLNGIAEGFNEYEDKFVQGDLASITSADLSTPGFSGLERAPASDYAKAIGAYAGDYWLANATASSSAPIITSGGLSGSTIDWSEVSGVRPTMTLKYYNITVSAVENCTTIGSGIKYEGEKVCIEAIPARGYSFVNWNESEALDDAKYVFDITADSDKSKTYTAKVTHDEYSASVTCSAGGSVTITKKNGVIVEGNSTAVYYGDIIEVTATPNAGVTFDGWYVGAELHSRSATCTYTVGEADVTLEAKWR